MNLETLHEEIKKDLPIDAADLGKEALRCADLFIKYMRIYNEEKSVLRKLENQRKKLALEKREYYSGNGTPEQYKAKPFDKRIRAESELIKYIDADDDICELDNKIDIQIQKVETLQAILTEVKGRTWQIKNAIDYTKFVSGA